jgi:ATP-binding cassette subfamily A (ABC1) protein 3
MEQIRKSMSICPQHDVLHGRLTVVEHLRFAGIVKGLSWKEVNRQISEILDDIDLLEKKDTPSSQLSGGQKRKLSVCIALIGGPKFVVLDEPTSGMDPYARRATWNLLIKHKKDRTILFSTHFMDEADVLGDRIAIMAAGKLRCSGSSLFLKSRYGVGYHMVMEKTPSSTTEKVVEVVSLMQSHVQGAKCVVDAGAELAFILPAGETSAFPTLFQELERRKDELGLAGFGVSVTTMEEVFLKVKDESDEDIESRLKRKGSLRPSSDRPPVEPAEHSPPPTEGENVGVRLWWQQYYGLLVKKTLDTVRYWQVFIAMCLLPIVATLLSLVLFLLLSSFAEPDPARELSVENTAIDTDNQILFWAEFGGFASAFHFESLEAQDVGATEFLNITAGVEEIMDSVQSTSNATDCCDYRYQILDKYCALRSAVSIYMCTRVWQMCYVSYTL